MRLEHYDDGLKKLINDSTMNKYLPADFLQFKDKFDESQAVAEAK